MPRADSRSPRRSAQRFVRTNTSAGSGLCRRNPASQSIFSARGTTCATCVMVEAGPRDSPIWTYFGSRMIWVASCVTSADIVAENSSVCRLPGSVETMRRTSGQNPMSSMRSASSSTSTSTASKLAMPLFM
jgi:hypothetical protein